MSARSRRSGQRVLVAIVAGWAAIGIPAAASGQEPELQGAELGLDLLERLEYTRAGADGITASMSLVGFEPKYCAPPDTPNKDPEREFLDARDASLDEYIRRYRSLKSQLLNAIQNDGHARRAVEAKFPGANPVANTFWQRWEAAFRKAREAIRRKRDELDRIPVEPCRLPPQPEPPPPPPPTDPGVDLPDVKVRTVEIPPIPDRFCSQADKDAVLNSFRAVEYDFYLNYQDAREYHDAIQQALARGQGNASVLREMLPAARENMDLHAGRHDKFHQELERVRAMPVVDCPDPPQPTDPANPDPLTPPDYVPFVFPGVPDRFCTQGEKEAARGYLESARTVAQWNSAQAAAWVTELGARIARGDQSPTTSAAFQEANRAASAWLQQAQDLDAALRQVEAMPVVECAPEPGSPAPPVTVAPRSLSLGFTVAATWFPNFERNVGDQPGITEASASNSPIYVGALVELNPHRRLRLSASVHYGSHRFTQAGPVESYSGKVNGLFVDSRISYVLSAGGMNFIAGGGITYARNELHDFLDEIRNLRLPDRIHNGVKGSFGVAAELPVGGGFAGRAVLDHTTSFQSRDADAHWRMGVAVTRNFRF